MGPEFGPKTALENPWVYNTYAYLLWLTPIKAAEPVSFRNYCMWIFLFYKKLHMTKLSFKVKLIPWDKPFYEFSMLAFVPSTTFSIAFCCLYNSVTEEIRIAMSIKHQFMDFTGKWLKCEIPATFITCIPHYLIICTL